ncbi:MAG: hypothetical protein PHT80_06755 [Lentisphaeria bacterium]|nr:hypothetical protein [Lentisphaeria bacterium]
MELTCLPGIYIGGVFGRHYQWVTDYCGGAFFVSKISILADAPYITYFYVFVVRTLFFSEGMPDESY